MLFSHASRPAHERAVHNVQQLPPEGWAPGYNMPDPLEQFRHLSDPNQEPLDTRVIDLTLVNATSLDVTADRITDLDHKAMLHTASRLIHLHVTGRINLITEPNLAVMVDAGFGLLSNYADVTS